VQAPTLLITGSVGIWLFYVQHQFEDSYWQSGESWRYEEAALRGSSYLKLPQLLQFFTASTGFHDVHHLNVRIPNYNLARAHDGSARFGGVPSVSPWQGLRATRWKLWDERARAARYLPIEPHPHAGSTEHPLTRRAPAVERVKRGATIRRANLGPRRTNERAHETRLTSVTGRPACARRA
jgi:fatty acid desaturase